MPGGARPAGSSARFPHEKLGPSTSSVIGIAFRIREGAAHGCDQHRDARNGPALEIEEASLDHLFGSERDLGVGLIVVEVEPDPARTIAGRRATAPTASWCDDDVRMRRPGTGPSRPRRSRRSRLVLLRAGRARPGARATHRPHRRLGTGLPLGSSTRPTTNIRPGAGLGLDHPALRRPASASSGEVLRGSSLLAGSESDIPCPWRRPRGTARPGREFQLVEQHGSEPPRWGRAARGGGQAAKWIAVRS